jgi:uncharacterized protein (TIGR03905 family)
MTETYYTQGTCSTEIQFEVVDGIVKKVQFADGCEGNLTAISLLVIGMKVEDVIEKLKGLPCEGRDTSCPDQLARALEQWKTGQ